MKLHDTKLCTTQGTTQHMMYFLPVSFYWLDFRQFFDFFVFSFHLFLQSLPWPLFSPPNFPSLNLLRLHLFVFDLRILHKQMLIKISTRLLFQIIDPTKGRFKGVDLHFELILV